MPSDAVIRVRIIGAFAILGGLICTHAWWITRHPSARVHLGARALVLAAWLVLTGIGTVALNRIAAFLLVVPLAVFGVYALIEIVIEGTPSAIFLNLMLTGPMFIGPAIMMYRDRRCLR